MKKLWTILKRIFSIGYKRFRKEAQHYYIAKGQYFARLKNQGIFEKYTVSRVRDKRVVFTAVFGYGTTYKDVPEQINKLYGIVVGWGIHKYSARIGWMYKDGVMEIYAYWYIDGKRGFKKIGETTAHKYNDYEVEVTSSGYSFIFEDTRIFIEGDIPDKKTYRLFPYFGGSTPAPQDMMIMIIES